MKFEFLSYENRDFLAGKISNFMYFYCRFLRPCRLGFQSHSIKNKKKYRIPYLLKIFI